LSKKKKIGSRRLRHPRRPRCACWRGIPDAEIVRSPPIPIAGRHGRGVPEFIIAGPVRNTRGRGIRLDWTKLDAVFCEAAARHTQGSSPARPGRQSGDQDLDIRRISGLRDMSEYAQWYGNEASAQNFKVKPSMACTGIPSREDHRGAVVAGPGCIRRPDSCWR